MSTSSAMTIALTFKAIDLLTAPLKKINEQVAGVGTAASGSAGKTGGLTTGLNNNTRAATGLGAAVARTAQKFTQSYDAMIAKTKQLSEKMKEAGDRSQLGAAASGAGVIKSVSAFKDLEAAQTSLQVAMMEKGGVVNQTDYAALSAQAKQFGKDYMGSSEGFYKMFRVLQEQGIKTKDILSGTGKAVADFAAVTGEEFNDSALKIAKFQDSFGILAKDMPQFTDQLSKAKFAFGLDTTEVYYAMPYLSGALKQVGMQGLEASNSVLRMAGIMGQAGIPASQIGESLNQVFNRMADFNTRLNKKSPQMEEIREILKGSGIELNFWDKNEKFAGVENMIAQFEKLKGLTDRQKIEIGKKLFGDVGGKAVAIFSEKGVKGWRESEEAMKRQAALSERIAAIQKTLAFLWDSFTGTVKTFVAAIGEAITNSTGLKAILSKLNDAFDFASKWIESHKKIAGLIGLTMAATAALTAGVVALGTAVMVGGSVLSAYGSGLSVIKFAAGPAAREIKLLVLAMRGMSAAQVQRGMFGEIISGAPVARSGIMTMTAAIRLFNISMLLNPVGLAIAAIAAGALLVIAYWNPIKAFFKGVWQGLKEGFAPLKSMFAGLGISGKSIMTTIAPVIGFLKQLGVPLEFTGSTLKKVTSAGALFGKVMAFNIKAVFAPITILGKLIGWLAFVWYTAFEKMHNAIMLLFRNPKQFFQGGANIIKNIWEGMKSLINKPIETMKGLANRLRGFLPFSPAKEGALRDINRVRLVETIAESITPAPMVRAMKAATAATMIAAAPAMGMAQPADNTSRPAVASLARPISAGQGSGGITIHFAPQITVQGNGDPAAVKGAVMEATKVSQAELERMIERIMAQKQRRSF
ncbi:MAG: phage tail tape measure protein [Trichlorobacter sp.]|uniref:phage tail tape measure protein n=1 Tax=Trichlorobacter sp. TaxID=2911007 RepID=UPI00256D1D2F|nr:phage tail tape measure protein [Trichlorobacter sp.]MDK9716744.1 phage tail tape measure protein [Trichlorobacter sp.]